MMEIAKSSKAVIFKCLHLRIGEHKRITSGTTKAEIKPLLFTHFFCTVFKYNTIKQKFPKINQKLSIKKRK